MSPALACDFGKICFKTHIKEIIHPEYVFGMNGSIKPILLLNQLVYQPSFIRSYLY